MTRKALTNEIMTLAGTAILAALLFWMSLYMAGAVMFIPGAIALFVCFALFRRKMNSTQLLAEYGAFACLLAAQVSLAAAIVLRVLPGLAHRIGGLI